MKRIKNLIALSFLSGVCFGQQQKEVKQLDSIFSALNQQNQFNGSVLIAEKGKIIFEKGYGYSNEETKQLNNPETIFELASCSKQFTAAAIVLLKRQGKLKYEDKITQYLPELSCWDGVTVYDLLRHTSGLPHFMSDMAASLNRTKIVTNEDVIRFYATRKDTLLFAPKSRHQYCNTNYALLASIVERVSGKPFADFLSENIFKPLSMTHTFVYNRREQPRKIKNLAMGYAWPVHSFTKVISEDPRLKDSSVYFLDGVVGPAKVNSTVGDLYKWVSALKNNMLFTQKEFDKMTEVTQTTAGKNIAYGFGFDLAKAENKFSFGHTGNWDGFVSLISQNMIKNRTIIILENFKMGVFPFENITQVLEGKPVVAKYKKKIVVPEADMKKYTGIYVDEQNPADEHILTYLDGHLIYNSKSIPWDMRFFPIADNEFQAIRSGGADGMLRFTTSADGTTNLEMLQGGQVIGTGVRKKPEQ